MDIRGYLLEHGIEHGVLQYELGRDGYSQETIAGLIEIEKRIKEIDQRLEVIRNLLLKSQPMAIGRIDLGWQKSEDGYVRPRLTSLERNKKTGRWIGWTIPNDQGFKHLKKTKEFAENYLLMKDLMHVTGNLLKVRSGLLETLANASRAVKGRLQHDPLVEIDADLEKVAQRVGKLP